MWQKSLHVSRDKYWRMRALSLIGDRFVIFCCIGFLLTAACIYIRSALATNLTSKAGANSLINVGLVIISKLRCKNRSWHAGRPDRAKFRLLGDCFLSVVVLKITHGRSPKFWTTFFMVEITYQFWQKIGWATYILGDFFTNSSGHHDAM
jgi:hypothetical protein